MSTLPPSPNPSTSPLWYYIDSSNQTCGPLSADELQSLAAAGKITSETLVAREGDTDWKKFAESTPEGILPPVPPIPPMLNIGGKMHPQRLALLIASIVGALGAFLPWVHVPIVGSIPGIKGDGRITLALFLLSFVLCLIGDKSTHIKGRVRWGTIIPGFIAAVIGLWKIFQFDSAMSDMSSSISDIKDIPFAPDFARSIGQAISSTTSVGIGLYAVIFAGLTVPFLGFSFGTSPEFTKFVDWVWSRLSVLIRHWGPITAKHLAHGRSVILPRLVVIARQVLSWLRTAYSRFPKLTIGISVLFVVSLLAWRSLSPSYSLAKVLPSTFLYDSEDAKKALLVSAKSGDDESVIDLLLRFERNGLENHLFDRLKGTIDLLGKLERDGRIIFQETEIDVRIIAENGFMGMTQIELCGKKSSDSRKRYWINPKNLLPCNGGTNQATYNQRQSGGDRKATQYEKFRLGDFSYTIEDCESKKTIGSGYKTTTIAPDGAMFLLVHFTILNESTKTQTVTTDDFLIRDSKGREFRPSSTANTALVMHGVTKEFLLRELQPGIERECITAFELPEDIADSDLFLIVPEKGLFGKKHIAVNISVD